MLVLQAVIPPTSMAHIIQPGWESTSETSSIAQGYTRHFTGDSFRTTTTFVFDTTKAANMRHNRSHGKYFTLDMREAILSGIDAYEISTTMPSPFIDYDNDDGVGGNDEAEVVSEAAGFPIAGLYYTSRTSWSHSYYKNGSWNVSTAGGQIRIYENLSYWTVCCWPRDKYDTDGCCPSAEVAGSPLTYPQKWPPGFAPAAGNEEITAARAQSKAPSPVIAPDLTRGLGAYVTSTNARAAGIVSTGAARGVATFTHPLTLEETIALRATGIQLVTVEAVSTQGLDGLRWTYFSDGAAIDWDNLSASASKDGVDLLGFVAAEVVVPDVRSLRLAQHLDDVLLVDLSVEEFDRTHPGTDAVQNDLYWHYVGWE